MNRVPIKAGACLACVLLLALACLQASCLSRRVNHRLADRMEEYDRDGDGQLSRSEFQSTRFAQRMETSPDALFDAMDADSNGLLSVKEIRAYVSHR